MKELAIVAIPHTDDYVWNISSMEIPHLTILQLGDDGSFDATRAFEYIEHAAKTTLTRFGMDVERRGLLGEKDWDVLFFGKHNRRLLEDFRSYLLQEPSISTAYNSITQFPMWVPHLSLGNPDEPAKPDKRDYPGTSWVNFDRIALWTGDYEGPEVILDREEDSFGEVSMSNMDDDFLDHFGVKGMRWGVRKDGSKGSSRRAAPKPKPKPSPDHNKATRLTKKKKRELTNEELATVIKRKNLEQQYSNLNPSKFQKGQNIVKTVVATVGTVSSVVALASSPAGKAAVTAVKAVLKK